MVEEERTRRIQLEKITWVYDVDNSKELQDHEKQILIEDHLMAHQADIKRRLEQQHRAEIAVELERDRRISEIRLSAKLDKQERMNNIAKVNSLIIEEITEHMKETKDISRFPRKNPPFFGKKKKIITN